MAGLPISFGQGGGPLAWLKAKLLCGGCCTGEASTVVQEQTQTDMRRDSKRTTYLIALACCCGRSAVTRSTPDELVSEGAESTSTMHTVNTYHDSSSARVQAVYRRGQSAPAMRPMPADSIVRTGSFDGRPVYDTVHYPTAEEEPPELPERPSGESEMGATPPAPTPSDAEDSVAQTPTTVDGEGSSGAQYTYRRPQPLLLQRGGDRVVLDDDVIEQAARSTPSIQEHVNDRDMVRRVVREVYQQLEQRGSVEITDDVLREIVEIAIRLNSPGALRV